MYYRTVLYLEKYKGTEVHDEDNDLKIMVLEIRNKWD